MKILTSCLFWLLGFFALTPTLQAQPSDTLPGLVNGRAPQNLEELWNGFDPRAEPLEIEILQEWEEDEVVLRIVRFRIGVFKGVPAKLAAIYGYPKGLHSDERVPGLLQIHGGGQFADHRACLLNAKRGYATLSIAWAGRISAPDYRVTKDEVQLFWDNAQDNPRYRLTTDWGAVDGYHAPGRNAGNHFPVIRPAEWTLDAVESPRNSGWFLCALAARRSLTFLEQQPEVDPTRLGVYGHSMGGKLTVMTSIDSRVKAAAPSCGGISDRHNDSALFRKTIGDRPSLLQIKCPILFQSPSNDFHGRILDLPRTVEEIQAKAWRVTCSPHHNHQDTASFECASMLWMDQHLKGDFQFPATPQTKLAFNPSDGIPTFEVSPDPAFAPLGVDVYFTQDGKAIETPQDRIDTMSRFWKFVSPEESAGRWTAPLQGIDPERPLWVYANVLYPLHEPVVGAGYYYGRYAAEQYNLSSLLTIVSPEQLQAAGVKNNLLPTRVIESFEGDWQKEWFRYRVEPWSHSTFKLSAPNYAAPEGAKLAIEVQSEQANKLVLLLDDYAAEVNLAGGGAWQSIQLASTEFRNFAGESLNQWNRIRLFKLSPAEHLRSSDRSLPPKVVGQHWKGPQPKFRNLQWK